MVALCSRRLEALFGAALEAVTVDNIRGLITAGAQEAFDLDFKLTWYGRGDSDRRALAGDVAALANTAGGVIVIGVDEDDQAGATAAPGVEVTDSEVSRIRQVVASFVAPLPVFDLISVMDPTCSTDAAVPQGGDPPPPLGFLLIAIPRSTNAPHAVLVNDALRYPRRNGATIRYLSEPEVAAAYRDRIAGVETQAQRVLDVERQALARLDRSQEPWLLVTLTPDLPGDTVLTASAFNEFQRTVMGSQTAIVRAGVTYQRASVGRRRLLADGTMDPAVSSARYASLELHTDGAGAYGLQLYDMTSSRRLEAAAPDARGQIVDDESIVVATISGLLTLAQNARDRAAAGGNAILRVTLIPESTAERSRLAMVGSMGWRIHAVGLRSETNLSPPKRLRHSTTWRLAAGPSPRPLPN